VNNPILEQLRDIHLPQAVHWWPPAPGWWILALVSLALITWLYRSGRARYRRQYFRGESQDLLAQLWANYQQQLEHSDSADREFIASTLALLRRAGKTVQLSMADDKTPNPSERPLDLTPLDAIPSPALLAALDQHSAGKLSASIALEEISARLYSDKSAALSRAQMSCLQDVVKSWLKSKDFKPSAKSAGAHRC